MTRPIKYPDLNYYQILGVAPTVTQEELRRVYKSLVQKMHPDKGGSEEAFQEIQLAYRTLSDPRSRALYDRGAKQGIDPQDFAQTLKAITLATINHSLNIIDQHNFSFDAAVMSALKIKREELTSVEAEIKRKRKIFDKALDSITEGEDAELSLALVEESVKLSAAERHHEVQFAVLSYLLEDSSRIKCEAPSAPMSIQWDAPTWTR